MADLWAASGHSLLRRPFFRQAVRLTVKVKGGFSHPPSNFRRVFRTRTAFAWQYMGQGVNCLAYRYKWRWCPSTSQHVNVQEKSTCERVRQVKKSSMVVQLMPRKLILQNVADYV
jgi:hypothetical protein